MMKLRFILLTSILSLLICLVPMTIVHAEDTLPKGFVAPEDMFGYDEERQTEIQTVNQLLNYGLIDGVYLSFYYAKDQFDGVYGKKLNDTEYVKYTQTMTNTPSSFAITKTKKQSSITVSGTFHRTATYSPDSTFYGDVDEVKNEMTFTLSNITFKQIEGVTHDSYSVYADVNGRLKTEDIHNGAMRGDADVFDLITSGDGDCYSSSLEENGEKVFYMSFYGRTKDYNWDYVTVFFRVAGVLPKGVKTADVTSNAWITTGEDGGVTVPVSIVIGLVSAGTALIGAATLGNSSNAALDEEKRRKSYKMYVQKDFGDSIRKGAKQASIVRARMAEIDELGKEHDRDDLTKNITATSNEMEIVNTRVNGRYFEAHVRVPANYESDKATLTFTFTGEGGTFINNVIFRVVDGAELQFILVGEGEGTYNENCGIKAIEGDGFTYDATFEIANATTPPKKEDISSTPNSNFDVEFEETDKPATFRMLVKNKTVASSEEDIFTDIKQEKFEINVKLEDEEKPLQGFVRVDLYQEGITFAASEKGEKNGAKYIQIQAYEKEKSQGLDGAWQATEIKITLAIKGDNKVIINPQEAEYEFDKLQPTGIGSKEDVERSIASKFEYDKDFDKDNYTEPRYTFTPKSHLCEPEDGTFFMVYLPVKATFDGKIYDRNAPLRLRGLDPDPMEKEWQKEYDKLKERIQKYSTPENKSKWEEKLQSLVGEAKPSVEELRLTSKYVVMQYMRYWTIEAEKHLDDAKMYDKIVDYLEWAKFFGDCAFSYLIAAYAGPSAASVVDAIVSPIKDFTLEAAGEIIAAKIRGQSVEFDKFDFVKVALDAGDNLISGNISFTDWKKAASTLGMYFAYATLKNFYINLVKNDKCDLYGALIAGFKDMTKAALTSMAGKVFDAVLKHYASSRKKISIKIGQFITENLGAGKTFDLRNMGDLNRAGYLRKVLDGLFGMGVEYLVNKAEEDHNKLIESETDIGFNEQGELVVKVYFYAFDEQYTAGINLTKIFLYGTAPLAPVTFFMYLYNSYFDGVPSANSIIEKPNDPPLPKS